MRRKLRSDCTVGAAERNLGLPAGTFRNSSGRDTRSDKRFGKRRKKESKNVLDTEHLERRKNEDLRYQ